MKRRIDPLEKTSYQRAIQTKIGQTLRVQYGEDFAAQPLSQRLFDLLMQLDEEEIDRRGQRAGPHMH